MKRLRYLLWLSIWFVPLLQTAAAEQEPVRQVTILAINDVYHLDYLPYVRSLRARLENSSGDVLLLHAGDFLFPSLMSRMYMGEHMVDVLNHLDGNDRAFDPYMFVTFGNHEFDKSRLQHAEMLQQRIQESQFYWLNSNVRFRQNHKDQPLVQAEQMVPSRIVDVNGVRVGLLGVVTDIKAAEYIERFLSPEQVLRKGVAQLRRQGAEVVVAVTHLAMSQDEALLEVLGSEGPDLIIGGHEHERQTSLINGRRIVKGDADARTVAVVEVRPGQNSLPDVQLEFVELPGDYDPEHKVKQLTMAWKKRFDREYCSKLDQASNCLHQPLGNTRVDLIAEELTIRRFETNLGNWLTDLAREQFSDQGAQIAFLNSGGMRLNRNLQAGSIITRKQIDTLFAYPTRLVMIRLTGAQLQQVLTHAVSDWAGSGHWLQISGFAFKHDPEGNRAYDLRLVTESGLKPIGAEDELLAVVNAYLVDESGDRDGYTMLDSSLLLEPNAERPDLVQIVIDALRRTGDKGIAPKRDGRICNVRDRLECPVDRGNR